MISSLLQYNLEKKHPVIEACLAQKQQLYQELKQAQKQSILDLQEHENLNRQSQSESIREESFGELESRSIQLDALAGQIDMLKALAQNQIYLFIY